MGRKEKGKKDGTKKKCVLCVLMGAGRRCTLGVFGV